MAEENTGDRQSNQEKKESLAGCNTNTRSHTEKKTNVIKPTRIRQRNKQKSQQDVQNKNFRSNTRE
jgi:hypothetical protein